MEVGLTDGFMENFVNVQLKGQYYFLVDQNYFKVMVIGLTFQTYSRFFSQRMRQNTDIHSYMNTRFM